jgi:hypothetical protein
MQGLPVSNSPRTQGFQAQNQDAQVEELFNDGFTQRAYDTFGKAYPDLVAEIVTLKIIDSDPDDGTACGVFILDHGQEIFYVPVVFGNNEIKPIDVFYSKRLDRYLPLSSEWLNEATKGAISELGHAVQTPKTLQTDVDIRNLVVPPTTGRYSYASANDEDPAFIQMLEKAPAAVKQGTVIFFAKHAALFKKAVEVFGKESLSRALTIKKASIEDTSSVKEEKAKHENYKSPREGNVITADKATKPAKLKEMFGEEAGVAYSTIRTQGFYAKDYRKETKAVISTPERMINLEEPSTSGLYRVYMADGSSEKALVIKDVVRLGDGYGSHKFELRNQTNDHPHSAPGYKDDVFPPSRAAAHKKFWLVIFKDGRYCETKSLQAEPVVSSHAACEAFMKDSEPKSGDEGFFVSTTGLSLRATDVGYLHEVRSSNGRTSMVMHGTKVVRNDDVRGKTILFPADQDAVFLPGNYRFIKVSKRLDPADICIDPKGVYAHVEDKLKKEGAVKLQVTYKMDGYYVGRGGPSLSKAAALKQVAEKYDLTLGHSEHILKLAEEDKVKNVWALTAKTIAKLAADSAPPKKDKAPAQPAQQDPAAQGGMDPSMGGDPAAMGMGMPAGPPQPSSIELAAAEMLQQLQSQQDSLAQQMQLLQQVAARAQQIEASGAGVMAAPLAAQMIAPPPQAGAPAPAAPPDPAAQPQDPSQGQIDPNTGMPMQQQQPMGRMNPGSKDLTPDNMAQSINPQFMQDAAALSDAQVFDAASVASLAQNSDTMELAQAYTPKIESALDSICRLLTLFNIKEDVIKEQFGQESYSMTVQKLRDLVKGMGDTLLKVEQMGQHRAPEYADAR